MSIRQAISDSKVSSIYTIEDLRKVCIEVVNKFPDYQEQVNGIYQWAVGEVESGEPEGHEVELAVEDMAQLDE